MLKLFLIWKIMSFFDITFYLWYWETLDSEILAVSALQGFPWWGEGLVGNPPVTPKIGLTPISPHFLAPKMLIL